MSQYEIYATDNPTLDTDRVTGYIPDAKVSRLVSILQSEFGNVEPIPTVYGQATWTCGVRITSQSEIDRAKAQSIVTQTGLTIIKTKYAEGKLGEK